MEFSSSLLSIEQITFEADDTRCASQKWNSFDALVNYDTEFDRELTFKKRDPNNSSTSTFTEDISHRANDHEKNENFASVKNESKHENLKEISGVLNGLEASPKSANFSRCFQSEFFNSAFKILKYHLLFGFLLLLLLVVLL